MATIYHITTQAEWDAASRSGIYEAASLKEEGFIHCSQEEQIPGVLQRYFKGKTNLVKLVIDTDKLTSRWLYEWSPSTADTFPHIYGPINATAVVAVEQVI
ncbi:DUF952 domain-containing protein [Paraflavitalea soli]|uniref:DUF952 domain-containing protein n=1 Tax=Paraflavitalea soli TaxID=2315862 RepID=A0A3B7MUE9_9BACT|nr:DUF952 domain-containing protein [Paraflavitalea soli]AXY78164.1 DUF952 domain-containing protein [Paraflavitalea soli]